jgi:hypothetical protein
MQSCDIVKLPEHATLSKNAYVYEVGMLAAYIFKKKNYLYFLCMVICKDEGKMKHQFLKGTLK